MKKVLLGLLIVFYLFVTVTTPLFAATMRANDSVYLPETEKGLNDLYLFGSSVTSDAAVTNDLVAAGKSVTINGPISGSLMAAGQDLVIRSAVDNTVRVAGSSIILSGSVTRDLLAAGGTVRVTKEASVSGDLLIAGGDIRVEGPVKGNVRITGGTVFIDTTIDGNVDLAVSEVTLGPNAKIAGNLSYTADQKATVQSGATVAGQQKYTQTDQTKPEKPTGLAAIFSGSALYQLTISIIICVLIVTFIPMLLKLTLERAINAPAGSGGTGLLVLVFLPLISLFMLFLLWLGVASLLLYGLLLVMSMFFGDLLIGWYLIRWWLQREKKEYVLDWKAAILGPVAVFILSIIPILGWLILTVVYLITLGALSRTILSLITQTDPAALPVTTHKSHS